MIRLFKSEFYIIYKRNIFYIYIAFIFIASLFSCLLYTRYNIVYPKLDDPNHVFAINLMTHSMLENVIFTFNVVAMSFLLIIFDRSLMNMNFLKGYTDKEIFGAKILTHLSIVMFFLLLFYVFNIILGLVIFDMPKSIHIFGKTEEVSLLFFIVYNVKYLFVFFLTVLYFAFISLFVYLIIDKKSYAFLITLFFVVIQLFFSRFSVSMDQLEIKKFILNDVLYFQRIVIYILVNCILAFICFHVFKRKKYMSIF